MARMQHDPHILPFFSLCAIVVVVTHVVAAAVLRNPDAHKKDWRLAMVPGLMFARCSQPSV